MPDLKNYIIKSEEFSRGEIIVYLNMKFEEIKRASRVTCEKLLNHKPYN